MHLEQNKNYLVMHLEQNKLKIFMMAKQITLVD